jgi:hypothetical protein
MGIRLETILTFLIVAILAGTYWVKLDTSVASKSKSKKELEFTDTTFIEVDTNKTLGLAYSESGNYENRIWTLYKLTYHTDSINYLQANKGTYINNVIYMDGNVTLEEKEGYIYKAQHVKYDKDLEELEINSPFTGTLGKNTIKGNWLLYKTSLKEVFAQKVHAVIHTREKE